MNSIKWTKQALKQMRKIDAQHHEKIINAVDALEGMPDVVNVKALVDHQYGFRLRVGDFRVLFDWSGKIKIVEIQEVSKRNERTY